MRIVVILFAFVCVTKQQQSDFHDQFRVVLEWNVLDIKYPSTLARQEALSSGKFVPENNLISDIQPYNGRLYLTVPRMRNGVPATLAFIPQAINGITDPPLEVFPSWEMNELGNCSALQFVQGIAIDSKGIMWVADAGRTETLTDTPSAKCKPKLMLLDLNRNGTLLRTYEFPEEVAHQNASYLNKIVLDGAYAYITDNSGADPGIIVYSLRKNKSWKVREPNSMRAARNAVELQVNGTNLNFPINIDGIVVGPTDDGNRLVYYCPLSSYRLYAIPASALRNETFSRAGPRAVMSTVIDLGMKSSQTDGMIMDNEGILYFGLLSEHAIAQWDSRTPFSSGQKVIARDPTFIQWTDGMGFDEGGNLYVVVNRLQNFVQGNLNKNNANFRILRAHTGTRSYVYTEHDRDNSYEVVDVPLPQTTTGMNDTTGTGSGNINFNGSENIIVMLLTMAAIKRMIL